MLAAASACAFIAIWYLVLSGRLTIASPLKIVGWHSHEMIFGYIGAVLSGFLLTATVTWTGLPTVGVKGLIGLVLLWLLARVVHISDIAVPGSAWIELVFFVGVAVAIGRPIVAARRWKNFVFAVLMAILGISDVLIHMAAAGDIDPIWGLRGLWLAIDAVGMVILVFAGRILPIFTKGALKLAHVRPKGPLDFVALASLVGLMLVHLSSQSTTIEAAAWAIAGSLNVARLYGWGSSKTLKTPLLWVLHLGWLLIGLGMLLIAYALTFPKQMAIVPAHHLLFVGGYGIITFGMMARVALGHTGREKTASRLATAAFVLLIIATIARVSASLVAPSHYLDSLLVAAVTWCIAYIAFLWVYAPVLLVPRSDGKPG